MCGHKLWLTSSAHRPTSKLSCLQEGNDLGKEWEDDREHEKIANKDINYRYDRIHDLEYEKVDEKDGDKANDF